MHGAPLEGLTGDRTLIERVVGSDHADIFTHEVGTVAGAIGSGGTAWGTRLEAAWQAHLHVLLVERVTLEIVLGAELAVMIGLDEAEIFTQGRPVAFTLTAAAHPTTRLTLRGWRWGRGGALLQAPIEEVLSLGFALLGADAHRQAVVHAIRCICVALCFATTGLTHALALRTHLTLRVALRRRTHAHPSGIDLAMLGAGGLVAERETLGQDIIESLLTGVWDTTFCCTLIEGQLSVDVAGLFTGIPATTLADTGGVYEAALVGVAEGRLHGITASKTGIGEALAI